MSFLSGDDPEGAKSNSSSQSARLGLQMHNEQFHDIGMINHTAQETELIGSRYKSAGHQDCYGTLETL
jgi:hypothetical protein